MKIKLSQLKRIIKEEVQNVLSKDEDFSEEEIPTEDFRAEETPEEEKAREDRLALHGLGHDKEMLLASDYPLEPLEEKLNDPSTTNVPLYRGISEYEKSSLKEKLKKTKTLAGEMLHFSGYSSFSEDLNVAKGFAKAYKTNIVMELLPGASGFNYAEWLANDVAELRASGDRYKIDAADNAEPLVEEKEWIFRRGSNYEVVNVIKGNPTIIKVKQT